MAVTANLPITPYTTALTCYPSTPQGMINEVAKSTVQLSAGNFTLIVIGSSTPASTDRDKLWYKTTVSRTYHWDAGIGAWVSAHQHDPLSEVRLLFVGTTTSLLSFDGGDGTLATPAPAAGAMWQVDSDFAGRLPMGPGAITGSTISKTLALDESYGSGGITLAETNLPAHTHNVVGYGTTGAETHIQAANNLTATGAVTQATTSTGSTTPFEAVPPVLGVYFIKRSARQFYVG